jgi:hypothetical protein
MKEMIMITNKNTLFKNRNIRQEIDLPKLRLISQMDTIIETKVDILYDSIKNKYRINEAEVYDRLYLKVRKMFLEEEN